MTSLARIRPSLRRAAFVAALGALMVPATAGAAVHAEASAKKKKAKLPVVTSVRPLQVAIGQTLEIRGKYFLRGRNKNSVVFKRDGGKAVFVKAGVGTTKLLRVKLPSKLEREFTKQGTSVVPTRFRVRVLAKKFGKKFTTALALARDLARPPPAAARLRRVAAGRRLRQRRRQEQGRRRRRQRRPDRRRRAEPEPQPLQGRHRRRTASRTAGSSTATATACSTATRATTTRTCSTDARRTRSRTDTCSPDSDGDGVEDGYEYQSALDLNDDEFQQPNDSLPYPGKRPYPNPLFPDAGIDYDGDVLTLGEEYALWQLRSATAR